MENQSSPIKCREPTEAPPNASSDSFQMISPQEKKRQQILAIAKKEEDNYNKFMQQNKLKHVNEVHYLGGN